MVFRISCDVINHLKTDLFDGLLINEYFQHCVVISKGFYKRDANVAVLISGTSTTAL